MYENFTKMAKKSMAIANQKAQQYNHEYIGTEHLLLGVIEQSHSGGIVLLERLGVNIANVKENIEKSMSVGPDMVTMETLPLTPRGKKVIMFASSFFPDTENRFIGTENLIYGLLAEEEGVASKVLKKEGVTKKRYEEQLVLYYSKLLRQEEDENCCESCICFEVCIIARHAQKTPMIPVKVNLNVESTLNSVRKKIYKVLGESCAYYKEKENAEI